MADALSNKHCDVCPKSVFLYCSSAYINTSDPTGEKSAECKDTLGWDDCCCTVFCMPFKLPFVFPCFFGALFNQCLNKIASTDKNYLC